MAKTTFRKVNYHASVNNTWLAPYMNCIVKLIEYKNGRIDLWLDGYLYKNVEGTYCSTFNGWYYTIKKILGRPLKIKA